MICLTTTVVVFVLVVVGIQYLCNFSHNKISNEWKNILGNENRSASFKFEMWNFLIRTNECGSKRTNKGIKANPILILVSLCYNYNEEMFQISHISLQYRSNADSFNCFVLFCKLEWIWPAKWSLLTMKWIKNFVLKLLLGSENRANLQKRLEPEVNVRSNFKPF